MNYYFRSQNSSSNCGMIVRKPKKSLKWADHNQEKPLQQIRVIDPVGKGLKVPQKKYQPNTSSKSMYGKKQDYKYQTKISGIL